MPAIPSWTTAGAFGIERTTGTTRRGARSIAAVGIAAATERTVCSGVSAQPISPSRRVDVLRLDRDDDEPAPATASVFESVHLDAVVRREARRRAPSRRTVATTSDGSASRS